VPGTSIEDFTAKTLSKLPSVLVQTAFSKVPGTLATLLQCFLNCLQRRLNGHGTVGMGWRQACQFLQVVINRRLRVFQKMSGENDLK
jgi:hypothetical protein